MEELERKPSHHDLNNSIFLIAWAFKQQKQQGIYISRIDILKIDSCYDINMVFPKFLFFDQLEIGYWSQSEYALISRHPVYNVNKKYPSIYDEAKRLR